MVLSFKIKRWPVQILDRLLAKVQVDKITGCWIWTGYSKEGHYGSIKINGRALGTHVAMFELYNGPNPPGLVVTHTCDVPRCINIKHLRLGTRADNMRDCVTKGRFRKPAPYKFTHHDIEDIKSLLVAGVYQREIARRVGCSQARVRQINKTLKC